MQVLITIGIIYSFVKRLSVIYMVNIIQAVQFLIFNLLSFTDADTPNHLVVNVVFSVFVSVQAFIGTMLLLFISGPLGSRLAVVIVMFILWYASLLVGYRPYDLNITDIVFFIVYFLIGLFMVSFFTLCLLR